MGKIASIDVFDTCLTRDVAVPTDLFYEVGKDILPRFGIETTEESLEDFVAARSYAYEAARSAHGLEDVILSQIWEHVCRQTNWPLSEDLWSLELAVEERHLFAVDATRTLILEFRNQGKRIVFTSDTYFPSAFVGRLLGSHGFLLPGDGLYTSGEIGKTKRSGALFQHMMAEEKVAPRQVAHFGDNKMTDFAAPRRLGINATILPYANLGKTEELLLQTPGRKYLSASRVAGAVRSFRVKRAATENQAYHELAASFLGPFLLGFVSWVLFQAQRDGLKRLYFVSRDCQLAHKTAQIIAPTIGDIDCRYLYHSRQALCLPLTGDITSQELYWVRRDYNILTLDRLLARLELKFEEVAGHFGDWAGPARGNYVLKSEGDWDRFCRILNEPPLRERIIGMIKQRRESALSYFAAEGLRGPVPWAVVDLGWQLTCQKTLQDLLATAGDGDTKVRGYYLGLRTGRHPFDQAGAARALYYQPPYDRDDPLNDSLLFHNIWLVELVLGCADHLSVHHYERRGDSAVPAFAGPALTEAELRMVNSLHESTLQFVRDKVGLVREFRDEAAAGSFLRALLERFALHPDAQLVTVLQHIQAADELHPSQAEPLISAFTLADVVRLMLPEPVRRLCGITRPARPWLAGSMAISPPAVRQLSLLKRHARLLRQEWCRP